MLVWYTVQTVMNYARLLLFLGLWMTIIPFLGLPFRWHQVLFLLLGVSTILVAFRLYIQLKQGSQALQSSSQEPEADAEAPHAPLHVQPSLLSSQANQMEQDTPTTAKPLTKTAQHTTPQQIQESSDAGLLHSEGSVKATPDSKKPNRKPSQPDRKLLALSAQMLGLKMKNDLDIARTTPRIRIQKPQISAQDIPISEEAALDEHIVTSDETIVLEDEELEVIVDDDLEREIPTPQPLPQEATYAAAPSEMEDVLEVIDSNDTEIEEIRTTLEPEEFGDKSLSIEEFDEELEASYEEEAPESPFREDIFTRLSDGENDADREEAGRG